MTFDLEWRPEALRRLADEWDQLDWQAQRKVMDALDDTDRLLKSKPTDVGESRSNDDIRVLIHPPIVLFYRVNDRMRLVTIFGAGLFGG